MTPDIHLPPGWPTAPATPTTGLVQLRTERAGAVVYVPGPDGGMVAVLREYLPTAPAVYQPRDLTPCRCSTRARSASPPADCWPVARDGVPVSSCSVPVSSSAPPPVSGRS
ncbi:hypothetical protein JHY03_42520 [Streptomyces sp. CA-256286]|nr:hypothetical protein JHY03_42520 [Streptomyces sp. CA-256286]